ncbi:MULTISPECIES: TonB-dependent hemoglobin/transferrin/lactoferrin family receptor [Vibrio]|uniref:TonB-dependent heme/hemoglobin receptor HutA n=1 Tax=Vibrio halioticoli NBRC 102217 TaxID=1219072 RepID=V5FBE4_9VIBR|nr:MULTISPECIES: TonB-dependent hemoglobin/transferrin/lactoferrin family receptor [Vibrio]MPW35892.1 TonB-dependent hemoglobin/transferrin/lactoferrin family receptor [Vibrio sp. B1Z05]GAD88603.1 TonB-dependent heme/hemoglobin receptor HutA [Vibrio halioticoli NBRC 102217]
MYKKTTLAVAISAIVASSAVFAEETFTFDEVVVSATKTEQNKSDVSSSVATVSRDDLDSQMNNNLKDTLKYTPGVQAQGSGRFGVSDFNIRGMDNSRVKVMVDSVQQPFSYNPGSTQQRKYPNTIETDTLAGIEVSKGSSSSLYGSDAIGGVVLMRTKNPDDVLITDGDENRFGIKSGYSSVNNEFKNTATWAMRQGKWETLTMFTYADGNEHQTHGDGADINGEDRGAADPADTELYNGLVKAFYQVNDAHRVGLTFEYFDRTYDETVLSQEGWEIFPGFQYSDVSAKDNTTRTRIGLDHEWALNSVIADDLKWTVSYQLSESNSDNYDTTNYTANGFPIYQDRIRNRQRVASDDSIQFDMQFNKVIVADTHYHELTYGASFLHNDFSLENTDHFIQSGTGAPPSSAPGSTGLPDATVQQWGVFFQDQAFLMDEKLVLTAGVRYDSFKTDPEANDGYADTHASNSDDAFTGRVGAVYHVADAFSPYVQVSQGFKAPTVYDLYYFYNQGAIFYGNPDLKAEKSLSYELGFRGKGNIYQYEVSGFYNEYDDFITTEKVGTDPATGRDIFTSVNIDEARIYGAEASGTVLGPMGTYTKLSVAYAYGEDVNTGRELDSVAPLTGVIGLGYDSENNMFGGLINFTMVASKDEWTEEDNVEAPAYNLLDITAYYRPINDLTLRAGLFNVMDEKYWLYEDLRGNTEKTDFETQAGRNWGVSLEYFF